MIVLMIQSDNKRKDKERERMRRSGGNDRSRMVILKIAMCWTFIFYIVAKKFGNHGFLHRNSSRFHQVFSFLLQCDQIFSGGN